MSEDYSPTACVDCGRERTVANPNYPMDSYDYAPMQAVMGQPLGWYSHDGENMCPECMTKMMRGGR